VNAGPRERLTLAVGGAEGVVETALGPAAAAIANAVCDAPGVRVRDLPITAERIVAAPG